MDGQKFCLKWNNFQSSVTSLFQNLRQDGELVDITLCCEGHKIKAHRIMLSACSPYFRELLKENPCQHPVFFLKDTSFADLSAVVEFMYRGEVNVVQNQLASFIKTAEMLQVKGLCGEEEEADQAQAQQTSAPPRAPAAAAGSASPLNSVLSRPRASPSEHRSLSGEHRSPAAGSERSPESPPAKRRRASTPSPERLTGAMSVTVRSVLQSPAAQPPGVDGGGEGDALDDRVLPPPPPSSAHATPQHHHHQQHLQHHLPLQQRHHTPLPYDNIKVEKVELATDDEESLEATFNQVSSFEASQLEGSDHSTGSHDMSGLLSGLGEQGMPDMSGVAGPSEDGSAQGGAGGGGGGGAGGRRPTLSCEYCGKVYHHVNSLSDHRTLHRGLTTCTICGKVYATKSTLTSHVRRVHRVAQAPPPARPQRRSRAGDED